MKVIQIGSRSPHVLNYVKAMSVNLDELILVTEESCDYEGVSQEFKVDFRNLKPISIIKNYIRLKSFIKFSKPTLIHIHQINRLAYFSSRIAFKFNIPVLSTAWGSDVLLVPAKSRFFRYLVKKTLERSAIVTADSQVMIDAIKKLVPNIQSVELIQYGIDTIDAVVKENIIFSNRLHEPNYRIDQVIEYFHAFNKIEPGWKLIIAGSGTQTSLLKGLSSKRSLNDCVEFVGWLNKNENDSWYARAKIYMSIPKSDGTSVSLLEAMSAECFPVVSDLPVSYEWIISGENGIIESQEKNPLNEALTLLDSEFQNKNKQLVAEKASRKSSISKFLHLYKSLIND